MVTALRNVGFTDTQIVWACDELCYTLKPDYAKVLCVADFMDLLNPRRDAAIKGVPSLAKTEGCFDAEAMRARDAGSGDGTRTGQLAEAGRAVDTASEELEPIDASAEVGHYRLTRLGKAVAESLSSDIQDA